jgi:hypothetical protein
MKLAIHQLGIITLVAGASLTSLQAQTSTLLALTEGGTLTSGNLVFSDFAATTSGNVLFPYSDISVESYTDASGENAIMFNDDWGLAGNGRTSPAQTYTLDFSFLVTDTDGLINGNLGAFTDDYIEALNNPPANSTTTITISSSQSVYSTTGGTVLAGWVGSFTGQSSVLVSVEIDMSSSTNLYGNQSKGDYEESFTETSVPEPGTFALLGAGACGLAVLRRKLNAK